MDFGKVSHHFGTPSSGETIDCGQSSFTLEGTAPCILSEKLTALGITQLMLSWYTSSGNAIENPGEWRWFDDRHH
jgi:hypothetical protein